MQASLFCYPEIVLKSPPGLSRDLYPTRELGFTLVPLSHHEVKVLPEGDLEPVPYLIREG